MKRVYFILLFLFFSQKNVYAGNLNIENLLQDKDGYFKLIDLESDSVFVYLDSTKNEIVKSNIGNVVVTTDGGMYVMTTDFETEVMIVMLQGNSKVNGIELLEGSVMWIDKEHDLYTIIHPYPLEYLNNFTLEIILDNQQHLLQNSKTTIETLQKATWIIENRY
ncbi:MAG: hypothetical protein FWF57_07010 [Defluviitaleaceae bacterium]|nr:hypothetical protein [Defluviitaleaceae bacterium]